MYTTKGKIQFYLGVDISSAYDTEVSEVIASVQAWIDKYVGKSFAVSATSDRYFDGNGCSELLVDSFVTGTITSLQILDDNGSAINTLTEGHSNDFISYPLNTTEKSSIVLVGNSVAVFPYRRRSVKITAKWGVSLTVPADIEIVATKLASKIIEKALNGGELDRTKLGDQEAQFKTINENADAMGIYQTLNMYQEVVI